MADIRRAGLLASLRAVASARTGAGAVKAGSSALGRSPGCAVGARGLAVMPGSAGQARTRAPPERVRPCRSRVRRLIAAHRVCSQALFLAVPR
jgi:hypothetical protein